MARIVTVYNTERRAADLYDMSYIRWFKISEALARRGHQVDIATAEYKFSLRKPVLPMMPNLRRVPLSRVAWDEYDVVKTLFHQGFTTLERYGGAGHGFIISKLGSVVDKDDAAGIYFYGRRRRALYATQERIAARSRFVTVLTEPARRLWETRFGGGNVLLVPGAVDRDIPPPGPDPYPDREGVRCVFSGNLYRSDTQAEANRVIVAKLNELGARLGSRGARLYVVGPGRVQALDPRWVTYLGAVPYQASWDYLYHARIGILVAAGPSMHNNESTKIYHYLRAGLPIVSEAGFPNDDVIREAALGFVVPNGDLATMASCCIEAAAAGWNRQAAVAYVLEHHTWDARAGIYDRVIRQHLAA